MKNVELFSRNLIHDSGKKHVSGLAEYTDDISEPLNTLYGAIGGSKKAHALIKKID
jgi:Xanthine dehydrogenase, molybdopterin-binding subunit B